jgi:hypothetical protein
MSPHDRARLRAETQCDDATIRRWARGDRVQDASRVRLTRAARMLRIRIPERTAPKERVS